MWQVAGGEQDGSSKVGREEPPEAARVSGQEATMSFRGRQTRPSRCQSLIHLKSRLSLTSCFRASAAILPSSSRASLTSSILNSGNSVSGKSFFSAHEGVHLQNKWVLKLQDPGFGTRRYSDDAYNHPYWVCKGSRSYGITGLLRIRDAGISVLLAQ